MNTNFLLLWLEAPLQSWGFDSKFSRRDTLNFPTKSGLLGLLCCALGAGGKQRELLAQFAMLTTTVVSFSQNRLSKTLEEEPLLRDFHMVGAGYNEKDPFEILMIPKKQDGKKANGGVKMTFRYYLQDAAFAAILEVPTELSKTLAEALQNPVWDLYLGRKSCVPTDFIYRGIYFQEQDAIAQALEIAEKKSLQEKYRVVDGEHEGDVLVLNDVPVQFGESKQYTQRHVTVVEP